MTLKEIVFEYWDLYVFDWKSKNLFGKILAISFGLTIGLAFFLLVVIPFGSAWVFFDYLYELGLKDDDDRSAINETSQINNGLIESTETVTMPDTTKIISFIEDPKTGLRICSQLGDNSPKMTKGELSRLFDEMLAKEAKNFDVTPFKD